VIAKRDGSDVVLVYCSGAKLPRKTNKNKTLVLDYHRDRPEQQNVTLLLSDFIRRVFHLPDRIRDLLEIAAYVFCADRSIPRGDRESLGMGSWSRSFKFIFPVRDLKFWQNQGVARHLSNALVWATGDRSYEFKFCNSETSVKVDLFDDPEFVKMDDVETRVILFSGGLDSLAGIVHALESSDCRVCAISHKSQNPSTAKTQSKLIDALNNRYPGRVIHRELTCSMRGVRAPDENQRSRAFLYCSMGLAMAKALNQSELYVYENGVTALNLPKREGMYNARASRTAHPKTIRSMEAFFRLVVEGDFRIQSAFNLSTKTDIIESLKTDGRLDLLNSTVSCSKTYKKLGNATHCGGCSQCVDRRFASYASECDDEDEGGIYALDFITENVTESEQRTVLLDFVRQAYRFNHMSPDQFNLEFTSELADAIDPMKDEAEQVFNMASMCRRHGEQVSKAIGRMINPLGDYPEGSLNTIISQQDFKKPPVDGLIKSLCAELEQFIRKSFSKNQPKDENDLNDKIAGYLSGHKERFVREFPALRFAAARTIPDHSHVSWDLLIETKYIRGATSPSKANEGIAADLTKYPDEVAKLFIVFDPDMQISDRRTFISDFEAKRNCRIFII
jgi:7-cyano-7-deazaguanine synthase in queuosine biosynthesis